MNVTLQPLLATGLAIATVTSGLLTTLRANAQTQLAEVPEFNGHSQLTDQEASSQGKRAEMNITFDTAVLPELQPVAPSNPASMASPLMSETSERPAVFPLIAQNTPDAEDTPDLAPVPRESNDTPASTSAQDLSPGRDTRSGSSYIGVGGNFGAVGDTSVGDSGLIIYSKIGMTRFFSVRPGVTTNFTDDATFLLPATVDFAPIAIGDTGINLAPYVGGGFAVSTDGDFGPLVTGGVDLPINDRWTATAGVNAAILDPVDVGVFLGIGYNFPGLF